MASTTPANHPRIDWTVWEAPGEGDVRSPCPMLNSLANHGILPHSGKAISKEFAVKALTASINLDANIAKIFASVALTANPDAHAHSFDLDHVDKHGVIEHDVSLTRDDVAFGDNHTFNPEVWQGVLDTYSAGGREVVDFASGSKARYERVKKSKAAHQAAGKDLDYGIKEAILSYGETALLMGLLGDPKTGKIPIKYLKVLVEEERLPYKEGWRPSDRPITQSDMNHLIYNLVQANDEKAAEASEVGVGTVHAMHNAVALRVVYYFGWRPQGESSGGQSQD